MESATRPETTQTEAGNGRPDAEETFEVRRPSDGGLLETLTIDAPAAVSKAFERARAAQPAWEAIGFDGRRRWLEGLRDWILDNQDRLDSMMQAETRQGPGRRGARVLLLHRRDQLLAPIEGPRYLADEIVTPHNPLLRAKRSKIVYAPFGVDRQHQPLELPPDPLDRRLDPGSRGRQRGRPQALASSPR